MDNVSFTARININYQELAKKVEKDKFFNNPEARTKLYKVLDKVEDLSKHKEDSLVQIEPRLDNNRLNLICRVWDSTKTVWNTIEERGAEKISKDKDFAKRFVGNISKNIKNVDAGAKNIEKIREFIAGSKTIKNNGFIEHLAPESHEMINELNKGNNPTRRIISILKRIEKRYPNEENVISIRNIPSQKGSRMYPHFCINNSEGEKKVLLKYVMNRPKDSIDNLF